MTTIHGRAAHLEAAGALNIRPDPSPWFGARCAGEVPDTFRLEGWSQMNGVLVPPGHSPYDYTGLRCCPAQAFNRAAP